ncbi:uncharacterized protein [Euphorbia lathyris]
MQQFNASLVDNHFHSVLPAVVHALDNPFGSISATFEAVQVVIKLAAQLRERMRESSHIWAPPIYRRMLSMDKKERDMSERCLLKIRSVIIPPPAALPKGLIKDMKCKLLTGMKDLLNQGLKIQTLQAWGWFIRLLGCHALENRRLINDMLKIPEKTFSDCNPQVQVASQVAWEGLIDALIHPSAMNCEINEVVENGSRKLQTSIENGHRVQVKAFSKSIKLLMTPLIGVISSKCDISVHLTCLKTWCYLLHKLDISINHPLVLELVLDPVFEAVFRMGPGLKTIWLWSLCLDLLDNYVIEKSRKIDCEQSSQVSQTGRDSVQGSSISGKCLVNQHSIKWSPWGISQLEFFIKMINIILTHTTSAEITLENRSSACDAALRIFKSILKGVNMELKSSSIKYADIMFCLNTILRFLREMFGSRKCGDGDNNLQHDSFQFLQAVIDELEPSILESPLYKVALDLTFVENLQSVNEIKYEKFLGISFIGHMDMVSPMVYLVVLGICILIQSTPIMLRTKLIPQGSSHRFFKLILHSCDTLEILRVAVGLLYKCVDKRNLHVWIVIAEALLDCFGGVNDRSLLRMETDSDSYLGICHLLSHPFVAFSSPQNFLAPENVSGSLEESHVSADSNLELDHVTELWKSVYSALRASKCPAKRSISLDLCSMLNWCIDENLGITDCGTELDISSMDLDVLSLSGNVASCILEDVLAASSDGNKNNLAELQVFSDMRSILGFASRFLKLSCARMQADPHTNLPVISRVFSVLIRLVGCLHSKETILSVIEIITGPLLMWLSHDGCNDQVQSLLAEIFNCLRRSQPPIVFDSVFLKLQAPLLQKTLNHPDFAISELTTAFWNSTYGQQIKLDYPESLLDILDKLSRNKKINLQKKSLPFLVKCNSITDLTAKKYRVTASATHNRSSKRVELVQDAKNDLCCSSKRKRLELTEHQKEVRREQQGRTMYCSGHGPGVRTYTSVDFSQGNDDSQDSQETQIPDSILEMLRKVA